ncbi:hypothetical protein DERF_009417 [Dermatophagoides farinae]|uniref:Uncharacterized protein n=1 Tax=Dermatophagoides farinae TaxID=6954 RepID=A0A922HXX6_DERFA|nr:hypothetical protein DERF_009417 [Dermatophagoides farinae]
MKSFLMDVMVICDTVRFRSWRFQYFCYVHHCHYCSKKLIVGQSTRMLNSSKIEQDIAVKQIKACELDPECFGCWKSVDKQL